MLLLLYYCVFYDYSYYSFYVDYSYYDYYLLLLLFLLLPLLLLLLHDNTYDHYSSDQRHPDCHCVLYGVHVRQECRSLVVVRAETEGQSKQKRRNG